MKDKDIGQVSLEVRKILEIWALYTFANQSMPHLSNTGSAVEVMRCNGGCPVYCESENGQRGHDESHIKASSSYATAYLF